MIIIGVKRVEILLDTLKGWVSSINLNFEDAYLKRRIAGYSERLIVGYLRVFGIKHDLLNFSDKVKVEGKQVKRER